MLNKKSLMTQLTTLIDRVKRQYKLARYMVVGATNTVICSAIMYGSAKLGFGYLSYTAIGYLIGIMLSFFMNLRFTFRVQGHIMKRLILYFSINLTNLLLVEVIEYVLIEVYSAKQLVAIMCGMTWYMITGYLMNNYWVYRQTVGINYAKETFSLRG